MKKSENVVQFKAAGHARFCVPLWAELEPGKNHNTLPDSLDFTPEKGTWRKNTQSQDPTFLCDYPRSKFRPPICLKSPEHLSSAIFSTGVHITRFTLESVQR